MESNKLQDNIIIPCYNHERKHLPTYLYPCYHGNWEFGKHSSDIESTIALPTYY